MILDWLRVIMGVEGVNRHLGRDNLYVGGNCMFSEMKAYAHLKPGQKGTMRLVEKYGKALLCVRYRFDQVRGVKLKTVEIVVDERPMQSPRFKDGDMVPVSVAFDETELRELLKKIRRGKEGSGGKERKRGVSPGGKRGVSPGHWTII